MLSNPKNLQRHRQHRRQQSTPTAYDAPKVPTLPTNQKNASHRRGMSLDQRRRQSPTQDTVSITNQGLYDNQQHILQETQKHRLARQGQQPTRFFNPTNDENYLLSPLVTPQRKNFDIGCIDAYGAPGKRASYSAYPEPINSLNRVNEDAHARNSQFAGNDSLLYQDEETTPSAYVDFSMAFDGLQAQESWNATIKPNRSSHSRRISGSIADRVAQYEDLAARQSLSRPITPPNYDSPNYIPLTPAHTPFARHAKVEHMPQAYSGDHDTSMEATIKPTHQRNRQSLSNFQYMRIQAEINDPPSPPSSSPMPNSSFIGMPYVKAEPRSYESPYQSPTHSKYTPQNFHSQSSSPELSQRSLYRDPFDNKPHLDAPNGSYPDLEEFSSQANSPMPSSSLHHRSFSEDSAHADEAHAETGITTDDIACYISGPSPTDQKYLCLFPSCNKRFGRKENIKSHVQTHLGDRQFQCPHCRKCFVRQHDLKRHAKIHSGVKPYPCACGNSFARHDALTRHRQRGMCVGAFEGVVKKVVKRGRPRKHRPEHDERVDKAQRTRTKNKNAAAAAPASNPSSEAPSSASEYSESSYGLSPAPQGDYDVLDAPPFAEYAHSPYASADPFIGAGVDAELELEYAMQPVTAVAETQCISPQAIQNAASPAYSHHSHHTAAATSPTLSARSPPDLCASTFEASSPSASLSFYDMPGGQGQQDADEMFLEAFGEGLPMVGAQEGDSMLSFVGGKEFEGFGGGVGDVDELFGEGAGVWVD
ncbi:hypothetical protein VE02_04271 [Pseudogymnoascus sp. 03VT05]|nr:hypothetical protein VE02_04271 [Pseudogymnoascus sp. 03VT05]